MRRISIFVPVAFLSLIAAAAVAAQDGHSIDLMNRTYHPSCGYDAATKNVTVKDGEYSFEKKEGDYSDHFYFKVFDTAYGDVNGDGRDEAIAITACNTGGTGNFTEGFIFTQRNGRAVLLATIPGGDRADGGIKSVTVEGGLIVVEVYDPGKDGAACCPRLAITTRYQLKGAKLVAVGAPVTRDLFPVMTVNFARGASSASMKFVIPVGEGKRLRLGARAGQTMKVTTDNPDVQASLDDDARVTESANGFSAKLPRSGEYTINVANQSESEASATITITIQ